VSKSLIEQGHARLAKAAEPDPAAPAAEPAAAAQAAEPAPPPRPGPPGDADTYPVHLDREEPKVALNVKVKWRWRHGLPLLAARNGTTIEAEMDAALAAHFARAKFTPPDFFRGLRG
jgi:hypothetical protein